MELLQWLVVRLPAFQLFEAEETHGGVRTVVCWCVDEARFGHLQKQRSRRQVAIRPTSKCELLLELKQKADLQFWRVHIKLTFDKEALSYSPIRRQGISLIALLFHPQPNPFNIWTVSENKQLFLEILVQMLPEDNDCQTFINEELLLILLCHALRGWVHFETKLKPHPYICTWVLLNQMF